MIHDATGIPSFGVEHTQWKAVQGALKRLGAEPQRITRSHQNLIMRFGDVTIDAGPTPGKNKGTMTITATTLKRVLAGVIQAGIDPVLFLAVLDSEGVVSWYEKPADVTRIQRLLREENPPLGTPAACRAVMRRLAALVAERSQPAQEDEPVQEAEPQEPQLTRTMADVMGLLGIDETAERQRLGKIITKSLHNPGRMKYGGLGAVLAELVDAGELKRQGKGRPVLLTDGAVLRVATALDSYLNPQANEDAVPAATQATPEPAPERPHPRPYPGSRPSTPPPPRAPTPPTKGRTPGEALIYLCDRFDVEPTWDGFTLDVPTTLVDLADAVLWRS